MTTRLLTGQTATVSVLFYDGGTLVQPDDPTNVTYVVTDDFDGSVVAAGTATDVPGAAGLFTFDVAPPTRVANWTVAWAATIAGRPHAPRSYVEVTGAEYATVADVRGHRVAASTTSLSDDLIAETIHDVEHLIDRYTGAVWIPRAAPYRTLWSGRRARRGVASSGMTDARTILAARVDGTTVADLSGWQITGAGVVIPPAGAVAEGARLDVLIERGRDRPPPPLAQAAAAAAAQLASERRNAHAQVRAAFGEGAFPFQIADVDRGRLFGIDGVDAVVNAYRTDRPATIG